MNSSFKSDATRTMDLGNLRVIQRLLEKQKGKKGRTTCGKHASRQNLTNLLKHQVQNTLFGRMFDNTIVCILVDEPRRAPERAMAAADFLEYYLTFSDLEALVRIQEPLLCNTEMLAKKTEKMLLQVIKTHQLKSMVGHTNLRPCTSVVERKNKLMSTLHVSGALDLHSEIERQ